MTDFTFTDPIFNATFVSFLRESKFHGELTVVLNNGEIVRAEIKQSILTKDKDGRKQIYELQLFSSKKS